MSDSTTLTKLKAAYRAWHDTKGGNTEAWLELMDDQVCIHAVNEESPGLKFATDCGTKQEAVEYFTAIVEHWDMLHWTPDVFVEQGDSIAMFGRCSWRNRATGKAADVATAHLWRFRDGRAVEFRDVFDSAQAVRAATPD